MSSSPEPFLISQLLLRQKPLAELEAAAIQTFKKPRTPDGVLWRLRFYREIQKFADGEIAGSLLSRRISAIAKEEVPYIFFDFVFARAFTKLPRSWVKKSPD
jgi:hypothetical protein